MSLLMAEPTPRRNGARNYNAKQILSGTEYVKVGPTMKLFLEIRKIDVSYITMQRITSTIPDELKADIQVLATDDKRSFSEMVCLLLQLAVKEKTRKRKSAKADN